MSVLEARQALIDRYLEVRGQTDELCAPLSAEDQTVQSMPDVSPTKWHRAHVTWFFENFVLAAATAGYEPVDRDYWYLFNSYYESLGPRYPRASRGHISRPGAVEVGDYRREVDLRVVALLRALPDDQLARLRAAVVLGLHHEQQHQELILMDIKHVLSRNPLRPSYAPNTAPNTAPLLPAASPIEWVEYAGGVVEIGHEGAEFHFDNEGPRHRVFLQPFQIADRLVTAGEWLAFIDDGGYARHELWLSEGWAWLQADAIEAPLYWFHDDGVWWEHTLNGTRPVVEDEPARHVSHFEADAYATWAGARLPTEFEWEHAVAASQPDRVLRDLYGECWQWTSSAYLGYPGFAPVAGAIGEYNGKFMSNQMVLRGSSALTPAGHSRATYRNFFPSQSRWAMSGVRLADGQAAARAH
ncbi:MAG: ergothioneine biosynthesis protein EgtB [Actinobacteria bacterium]|uniref:Unannotated protein n=1 Tax=freshwater metagenome TaxID=449393 RepID=A0A6J7QEH3_9ZZZZ|nr:ergothioneine biosynthesis protein EgtB [Actinomycetota bacterium]